jgi:hypothetical protein
MSGFLRPRAEVESLMSHEIDARLAAQGITLPTPAAPAANYVAFVIEGGLS